MAVCDRLHGQLALQALEKDITMRRQPNGLTHYFDRGSQFCSFDKKEKGIMIFTSGKGNCYDDTMVGTFFKSLKSDVIWRAVFQTRNDVQKTIANILTAFIIPSDRIPRSII